MLPSRNLRWSGAALLGGIATSLAHPPHGLWFVAPLAGVALSRFALHAQRSREAICPGVAFGIGLYGASLGWLFAGVRSMDAPVLAYGAPSLLILAFSAAPAAIAWAAFSARQAGVGPIALAALLIPGLWTIAEWLRHFGALHFPWGHLGYTQVPDSPLAMLAPLTGVLGLSFASVMLGGVVACAARAPSRTRVRALTAGVALAALCGTSAAIDWTRPVGKPISAALFQGAFPMSEKFDPAMVVAALEAYGAAALDSTARITAMPETALPLLEHQLPSGYLASLERIAKAEGRDVLLSFFRRVDAQDAGYFSSARVIGVSGTQTRDKRMLVPFGEYVPAASLLRPFYERVASVPLLDTVAGRPEQGSIVLGGVRVALKLCFEDLFAHRLRTEDAAAGFIMVLANDSWDGSRVPMHQHLVVAQARAAEAGKPLLRVANTGWSASIAHDGRILARAAPGRPAMLAVTVAPREGVTPYSRYGDAIPVGLAVLAVLTALAGASAVRPVASAGTLEAA